MKADVRDLEQRLQGVGRSIVQKPKYWMTDISARHDNGAASLSHWHSHVQSPCYFYNWNKGRLMADCYLDLTQEDVDAYSRLYLVSQEQVDKLNNIPNLLRVLLEPDCTKEKAEEIRQQMDEACWLREHKEAIPPVFKAWGYIGSNPAINLDDIMRNFTNTDEPYENLLDAKDRNAEAKADALFRENYEISEQYHGELCEDHRKVLEMCRERITLLKDIKEVKRVTKSTDELAEKIRMRMGQQKHDAADFQRRVTNDLEAMEEKRKEKDLQLKKKLAWYQSHSEIAQNRLLQNEERQKQIIEDIIAKVAEFEALNQERVHEVEAILQERELWEQAKAEHSQFVATLEEHKNWVSTLANIGGTTHEIGDHFTEYFEKIPDLINGKSANVWEHTKGYLATELRRYLNHFREYMTDLGDLIYTKEKRVDELQRRIRNLEYAISISPDTLDPNVSKYKQSISELESMVETTTTAMRSLQQAGDEEIEKFTECEIALKEDGEDFVHPKIEMTESKMAKRGQLLEKKMTMQHSEKAYLDEDNELLAETSVVVRKAKSANQSNLIPSLGRSSPLRSPRAQPIRKPEE
jgi:hypothetical protein